MSELTRKLDMGRVVRVTFGILGRNALLFTCVGGLFYLVPVTIAEFVEARYFPKTRAWIGVGPLYMLVSFFFGAFVTIVVMHHASQDMQAAKPTLGDTLSISARKMFPVVGLSFISTLAVMIGLLIFVIPGLMILATWAVAVPARVVEDGPQSALERSERLTKGHRGRILVLAALYLAVLIPMTLSTDLTVGLFGSGPVGLDPAVVIATALVDAASTIVGSVGGMVLYDALRTLKEGPGASVAEVFD